MLGGVSLGRLYPGEDGARQRAGRGGDRDGDRRGYRGLRQGAGRSDRVTINQSGWRPEMTPERRAGDGHLHRQPGADARRAADLRDRRHRRDRRRFRRRAAKAARRRLGRAGAQPGDRPAGPLRAGDGAALHPAQPAELRHRPRPLPARLLHDEAQSAAQREGGADAGLRRHPSAPAGRHRPGRARGDRRAGRMADQADRHARRRDEPEGGRAWRAVRPALHPLGAGGARRSRAK